MKVFNDYDSVILEWGNGSFRAVHKPAGGQMTSCDFQERKGSEYIAISRSDIETITAALSILVAENVAKEVLEMLAVYHHKN